MNSFELVYTVISEKTVIDRDYYNTKEEQCTPASYHYRVEKLIVLLSLSQAGV